MSLYSLPGLDLWLTTDPNDDGTDEAIERIQDELRRDEDEVTEAVDYVSDEAVPLIAAAYFAGTPEAWAEARTKIDALVWDRLGRRALDVLREREADAELAAAESAAEARASRWEDAA